MNRSPLDKELQQIAGMESPGQALARRMAAPGQALIYLALAAVWAGISFGAAPNSFVVVMAAIVAGYMALNIGANDVANNVGPAVGAKAISMSAALLMAAIFEAAGALIAGSDVVETVATDLLVQFNFQPSQFVLVMISALLASAMWVHLATVLGAPVSTTHSIVGGVAGAGIAALGFAAVSWADILAIAFGWVISPLGGGAIAAMLLYLTQLTITRRRDKLAAARAWVPSFAAMMTGTFAMYLATKTLHTIWPLGPAALVAIGVVAGALGWLVTQGWVKNRAATLENRKKHVASLFRLPLIFAAALLSFAHGANDVANAIGPLAAIVETLDPAAGSSLPFWVLAIGAFGISVGLALFGPRVVREVGEQITKLNEIRAFCASLATALTVLIASSLGMPVSTTHIAVGAVFGIGFLREYQVRRALTHQSVPVYARHVDPKDLNATPEMAFARSRETDRRRLVRRNSLYKILGAWTITLPCAAGLAAITYLVLRTFTL